MNVYRRTIRLIAVLASLAFIAAACGSDDDDGTGGGAGGPIAPEDDPFAELAAAAKEEEGALNYYFILGEEANRDLFDAFKARYPFVEIEVTSGDPLQLIERVVSESRSGQPVADIIQGGPLEERIINGENDLGMTYRPEGESEAAEDLRFDKGDYVVSDFFTFPMTYNTNVLEPDELPASLEELTEPEWRGRFGVDVEQIDWFAGELAYYGEEEGLALMEELAANDPVVFAGAEGYEQVAAGALPLAVNLFSAAVAPYFEQDAPIAFAEVDHIIAQPDIYIGLEDGPHPNTTRLFFEFLFTPEAQEILAEGSYKNPVLESVEPYEALQEVCTADCELFFETSENFGDFDTRVEQFQELFVR